MSTTSALDTSYVGHRTDIEIVDLLVTQQIDDSGLPVSDIIATVSPKTAKVEMVRIAVHVLSLPESLQEDELRRRGGDYWVAQRIDALVDAGVVDLTDDRVRLVTSPSGVPMLPDWYVTAQQGRVLHRSRMLIEHIRAIRLECKGDRPWRAHTDKELESLRMSMRSFGYLTQFPVVYDENGRLVDGVARVQVAKELGFTPTTVIVAGNPDIVWFIHAFVSGLGNRSAVTVNEIGKRVEDFLHHFNITDVQQAVWLPQSNTRPSPSKPIPASRKRASTTSPAATGQAMALSEAQDVLGRTAEEIHALVDDGTISAVVDETKHDAAGHGTRTLLLDRKSVLRASADLPKIKRKRVQVVPRKGKEPKEEIYTDIKLRHLVKEGLIQVGDQIYMVDSHADRTFTELTGATVSEPNFKGDVHIFYKGEFIAPSGVAKRIKEYKSAPGWNRIAIVYDGEKHTLGFLRKLYCERNGVPHTAKEEFPF